VASRPELTPRVPPLDEFPIFLGGWQSVKSIPVEKDIQDVLKADDLLNRVYVNASNNSAVYLFIAYFQTQRRGQSPHSPKNCLPGSGWAPIEDARIMVDVPGRAAPIEINKYVVAHGEDKSLTLYWYQSRGRVIASEFSARLWLVADAIRYRRSDTALVRINVPVRESNIDTALNTGLSFIKTLFPAIQKQLPL
jgi:EpsI family protein